MPGPLPQSINAATRYCAVYGHPVRHSASPAMQNAGIAELGLDWRYLAFDVLPGQLAQALAGARAMRFVGINLTVPHKLLALDLVDALDPSARQWGAVNTVRFEARDEHGQWQPLGRLDHDLPDEIRMQGFNTDAEAILRSLRQDLGIEVEGQSVLVLGAGGAGRVAALKLAAEGVGSLFLVNRTMEKAEEVAREVRRRCPEVDVKVGYPPRPVDLLLNATSLGLREDDPSPLSPERFSLQNAGAVYDMIYQPAETPLLAAARRAGCRTANGLGMLLYQGARALEIWSGQPAPEAAMRQALLKQIYGD